ncbi:MAG: hypothetical protein GYA24_01800 [Candidatus Lokiarchaeota archaeon]|nr:hypothetical protein [Candidatus Lokiarchaeota archaeon]
MVAKAVKEVGPGRSVGKNAFLSYFLGIIIAFFSCLLLARTTFPGDYSILEHSVSTLGVLEENPHGWFFFTMALWIASIGLLPYYAVLFKQLRPINKPLAILMLLLYAITSIGMFMAGTFQEGSTFRQLHLLSAYFGFGGFFLAGIFTWILVGLKLSSMPEKRSTHVAWFLIAIVTLSTGAALFITHLLLEATIDLHFSGEPLGPFIGFPFTEWLLVITIFIDKLLIGLIIASFLPR